jgi:hypothetical protein
LSTETGRMAAERGHVVGTLLSLSAAGPMFEAYRKRAQELGWTAGPRRFRLCGSGRSGGHSRRWPAPRQLAAEMSAPRRSWPRRSLTRLATTRFPPTSRCSKAGGKRGGFVRDRHGNPVEQTTASIEQLIERGTCFAGTPDDVYDQIKALSDSVGGFGNLLMFGQGGFLDHNDTVANITLFAREVLPRLRELLAACWWRRRRSPARGVRQAAVQLFDEVFEGDTPPQLAASLILMLLDTQSRAEPIEHLDDLGGALLGQQIDLQIEMIAAISNHPHAVLLHQHEGGEQDRLQRGDRRQQRIGEWIEWSELRECPGIDNHPGGEG